MHAWKINTTLFNWNNRCSCFLEGNKLTYNFLREDVVWSSWKCKLSIEGLVEGMVTLSFCLSGGWAQHLKQRHGTQIPRSEWLLSYESLRAPSHLMKNVVDGRTPLKPRTNPVNESRRRNLIHCHSLPESTTYHSPTYLQRLWSSLEFHFHSSSLCVLLFPLA